MSKEAIVMLRAYLDRQAVKGVKRVPLTQTGRESLRALVKTPLGKRREAAAEAKIKAIETAAKAPLPAPVAASEPMATAIDVQGSSKEERLARLAVMAEEDPKPRALGTLREVMVFAVGSADAQILFVGEAPGAEEERQREPFVGPAGQLLTKIITNGMGIRREDVYITNICKFRPGMEGVQGSRNRQPMPEEMRACLPYVLTEINIIQPRVIVALGATAAAGLGIEGGVGRLRARFHEFSGIPVMVTYHPSWLLRQEQDGKGMEAKRFVWEDMLMVMERIGMPISEKQRGFFKPKA
ncbi:MAG: uracil-DNA glycosylase [Verrucomicrobiaceae bacterium]|nr:uracil-DNA glycosylase [Verrucomicrobiaceae bacterium]